MSLNRAKLFLSAALALGLCSSSLWLVRADLPRAADDKAARVDAHGDPLPGGAVSRLGTLRWRHNAAVMFLAYSADGKEVITASQDGAFRVWEADTGKEVRKFGKVNDMAGPIGAQFELQPRAIMMMPGSGLGTTALSPDRKTLVATASDGAFTLWDVTTGKEIRTFRPNPGGANLIVFAPDGKSYFARFFDGQARQFDLEGKELRKFGEAADPKVRAKRIGAFFGAGGMLVSLDGKTLFSAAFEFNNNNQFQALLKAWQIEDGKELPSIKGPETQGNFNSVAFSPDGKKVAWGHQTGNIHVCDVATGKETARLTPPQPMYPATMAFSHDGRNLAVRGGDQVVRLWSVTEGKERLTLGEAPALANGFIAIGFNGVASSNLAFAPDSSRLATSTGANTVQQFDTGTGKEVAAESGGHQGPVTHLALSPDGKTVATRASDNVLRLWDAVAGKQTKRFTLPAGGVHAAFSADGKILVLGSFDGTVAVWDAVEGKELRQWKAGPQPNQGFAALSLSSDGKTLAVRGYDSSIRLWDAGTGKELRQVVAVANNANVNGNVVVLNATMVMAYRPMTQNLFVFSPDGTLLAGLAADPVANPNPGIGFRPVNAGGTGVLRLWDVSTGKQVRKFETPKNNSGIAGFAFAPDGRTLVTANNDGTLTLWESASGKECAQLSFKPEAKPEPKPDIKVPTVMPIRNGVSALACIAYSPDGKLLAVGGNDGVVHVCDAITGKERAALKGHQAGVVTLAFAANGHHLASGSSDTTAVVWDVPGETEKSPALQVEAKQAELMFDDLTSDDAAKAFQSIRILSQVPAQSVPMLKDRLKAVTPPDAQKVAQMIVDLDSNVFATRKQAEDELEKMGELAEDAIRKALNEKPSLEVQKRLEGLLAKTVSGGPPTASQLRMLRALEVLEAAGTPEARDVLKTIAAGAPGARVTRDAQGALDRLGKR